MGSHINLLFFSQIQSVTQLLGWSFRHFPTYKLTGIHSYLRWWLWLFSLFRWYMVLYWGRTACPISVINFFKGKTDNSLFVYLIEWNWWSYTLVLFLLKINVCLLVRLRWIKTNMPDRITCDEWIKNWILEDNFLYLSSIDINSEASYQTWSIEK